MAESKQTQKGLYDTLTAYSQEDIVPMHMPGHKRNPAFSMKNPYQTDVTEVEGMDDLHRPHGVIRDLMNRVTAMYGSEQSYLLVNGSTGGILAAIAACCRHGDRILMARNCHTSVYHAVRLLELRPVYLYPGREGGSWRLGIAGMITVEDAERALTKYADIRCVILTSPTYEGVVSPIAEIAEAVHHYGIPLIVDEAHGAHFHWHSSFPRTALTEGADLVVESLHKTLPALTQTGVLHARFERVSKELLEFALRTFQSSSPSYLLMAGIDRCFAYIEKEGADAFEKYVRHLEAFCRQMSERKHLYLFESPQKEPSKLVIATDRTPFSGRELADCLREKCRIETEMSCGDYCIAMTSVCDTAQHFERLEMALRQIDDGVDGLAESKRNRHGARDSFSLYQWEAPERRMYSYEAAYGAQRRIRLDEAEGCVAAEDIYLYPPGIPVLVQGEIFSGEIIRRIRACRKAGDAVRGVEDGCVKVIVL